MKVLRLLVIIAAVLAIVALVAGQVGLLRGSPPTDLGVNQGRLKAPSTRSNSVSSQAALWPGHRHAADAAIAPMALRGDGAATVATLGELVAATPGGKVVERRADYLRAEFTTRWMGFVDDVEFWFDPAAGVVQVRSASRLGEKDFGVNRQRIEALRSQLAAR